MTLRELAALGLELILDVRLLVGINMVRINVNYSGAKCIAEMEWKTGV